MNKGEFLARLTIWITLAGYFVGVTLYSLPPQGEKRDRAARIAWTVACLSLLAHFACAFHFYHHWSHDTAYRVTARQTAELFGLDWGGGLYLNYALLVGWVADVVWWWRGLEAYRNRLRTLGAVWQGFLLFMFFNATVVFKDGALRYIGLLLCLAVCLLWWYAAASSSSLGDESKAPEDTVKN